MPLKRRRRHRRGIWLAVVLTILVITGLARAQMLPHRSWQLLDSNWDHLAVAIPQAKAAGMNRIQLSHRIIMDAEQLWERKGHAKRLALVRKAIELAHANGLQVDMWTHELSGVPKDRFGDRPELTPDLWQWLQDKYERVFELLPGIDGLVLTFAETDRRVYTDEVVSDEPAPRRVARLIDVIGEICRSRGKLLIVRTFVYEPAEIGFLHEALNEIGRSVAGSGHVVIMTKCVPHDWTPFYPYNPLLGNVAGLPQIVEIDLGQEFTGQSRLLHCEVDYVKRVLAHARTKGVIGAVARVERYSNYALGTPNEVNIHAFSRLLTDPGIPAETLWQEWAVGRYGKKAAPHVVCALKRTFDITNLIYFPLEQWIADHSRLPSWNYAYSHITSRQIAKWVPSPKYERARDELLHPSQDTLTRIAWEKDLARTLNEASLADLERAKPHLPEADYKQLLWHFELARECIEVFCHHNLVMFTTLLYENRAAGGAGPEELGHIRDQALTHIEALRAQADRMEARYGPEVWPGNPHAIRKFAVTAEARLLPRANTAEQYSLP